MMFTYYLRKALRDKGFVFWSLAFPLILMLCFTITFKNASQGEIDFQPVNSALIIQSEGVYAEQFETLINNLADPEYVKETQLGFMTLDEPVVFRNMGNMEEEVKVDMMFMMAIKEAHGQVEMLMKLMGLFGDDAVISKLHEVDNFDDFLKIVEDAGLTLE